MKTAFIYFLKGFFASGLILVPLCYFSRYMSLQMWVFFLVFFPLLYLCNQVRKELKKDNI